MSGGVEMIAGPVVQHVAGKLGQIAGERIELIWNFKEDVEEMKDTMDDLQVALNSAEKLSQGNEDELVRHWLKKYKSVAYEIEDTLDELDANKMIWKNSPCKDLETLPEWLGDLTSLTEINIKDCPKLSSLPESIRRLTELNLLFIAGCRTLSERCQGEDQHKIAHIPDVIYE